MISIAVATSSSMSGGTGTKRPSPSVFRRVLYGSDGCTSFTMPMTSSRKMLAPALEALVGVVARAGGRKQHNISRLRCLACQANRFG